MKTRLVDWLTICNSGQTIKNYRWGITAFLRNDYGDGDIEVLAERYLDDEGRDHGQDPTSFFVSLKDKAPKSQSKMAHKARELISELETKIKKYISQRFELFFRLYINPD